MYEYSEVNNNIIESGKNSLYSRNTATLNYYLNQLYKNINSLISVDKTKKSSELRGIIEYIKNMYPLIKKAFYLDDEKHDLYDKVNEGTEEYANLKEIDAKHKYSSFNDILISLIPCGVEGKDIGEVLSRVVEEYYLNQFEERLEKFALLEQKTEEKDLLLEKESIAEYVEDVYPKLKKSYKDLQKINRDYPEELAKKSKFLGPKRIEALEASDKKNGIDQNHKFAALNDSLLGLIAFSIPKEDIDEMLKKFLGENKSNYIS